MKMITTHTTSKQAKQVKLTDHKEGGERKKQTNRYRNKNKSGFLAGQKENQQKCYSKSSPLRG